MKKALLKKRYGIPAALLAVLLVSVFSGAVVAWYAFSNTESVTKVEEPLSTKEIKDFDVTMDPGDTNTWKFCIVNKADHKYSVKMDLTFDAPDGVSITSFTVDGSEMKDDLSTNGKVVFTIDSATEYSVTRVLCVMEITAADDAAPGSVTATFVLSRA